MVTLNDNEKWRLEIISALKVFYYYLSWSEKDLMLGILHPGGGQYHCLSIMDDSQVLLHMNKFASATTFFPASFLSPNSATRQCDPQRRSLSRYSEVHS